jgi:hypothetical protein
MPDHVHLIVAMLEEEARLAFAHELSAFTRATFPGRRLWQPVPEGRGVPDELHLRRQIRYVHLNPCRAQLTRDPLAWEWTTHRDAIGAAAPSWIDRGTYVRLWGSRFEQAFHAYVTGDPTVAPDAAFLPIASPAHRLSASFDRIALAVAHVTRSAPEGLRRRSAARTLLVRLSQQMGTGSRVRIAEWTGLSPRAVRAALARAETPAETRALAACRLLLTAPERFLHERPSPGNSSRLASSQRGRTTADRLLQQIPI